MMRADHCSTSLARWPTMRLRAAASATRCNVHAPRVQRLHRPAPGVMYAISTNTESEVQVRDTPEEEASDPEVSNARQLVRGLERQLTSSSSSIDIEEEVVDKGEAESSPALSGFEGSVKGMILLNIGAALFGSNQVVIKTTEDILGPAELSALRFLIAAACFTPAILQGLKKPAMRKAAAELGTYLFAGYQLQAMGLALTTAGRGAFTGTFTVLTVPILVGLSGRKIGWKTWTAAAVALLGVALLTTDGADPNKGDLFCILSAICFGVHKWRTEVVTARFREETTQLVSLQLAALAVLSSLFCVPALVGNVEANGVLGVLQQAPQLPWLPLAFMGLGTTAFTLWIEMESLKEVSAPLAALIYTAEPVWGAGFAWLLLEERWSSAGWVGAMLVISSSLASQLAGDTVEKVGSKPAAEAAAPSSKRD